jgi:spore maturation protein CgeB
LRFVIIGLTLSSAWANGHATPLRALIKALHAGGHHVTFFERDVDYYAAHRDLEHPDYCQLVLYRDWTEVRPLVATALGDADVGIVTSYCPDGLSACDLLLDTSGPRHCFYDLDTPVTLEALRQHGVAVPTGAQYLVPELIPRFDLYLSFTGGQILECLRSEWGARRVAPLYGSVDPSVHARVEHPPPEFQCALGYLGTYAADRQASLDRLLLEPARRRPTDMFCVIGSMYPADTPWPSNIVTRWHLDPAEHPAFYSGSRATLNVTREGMRRAGYSPSGRVFEAAACGTPVVSDAWPGLESFFTPEEEILVVQTTDDVAAVLDRDPADLARIGSAARERVLAQHTGLARARELVQACEAAAC